MKYKKTVILLLTIIILAQITSQPICAANYYIFKFKGNVHFIVNNERKEPVLRTQLTLRDKFYLEEGAILSIADKESNRVYVTKEVGLQNVAQIISNARKQSASISKLACEQAYASMKNDSKVSVVLGAVNRGSNIQNDTTFLIFSSLYKCIYEQNYLEEDSISLEKVEQDGEWHFMVRNKKNIPLYVNILRIPNDKQHRALLCLDYSQSEEPSFIIIAPNSSLNLSQFSFAKTECQYKYLLFASESPFDSQSLRLLFNSNEKPDSEITNIRLYMKSIIF